MPDTDQLDGVEAALRAMLADDAQHVQETDLRPLAVFPPTRSARPHRMWAVAAAVGVAAASAGLLVAGG